jgi:hypothetical protein
MALQKQPVAINFAKGLDSKTDPYQLSTSSFTNLTNTVFNKVGRLTKRNGFSNLTSLPNTLQTNLTTLNGNLTATGSSLYAYSQDTQSWLNRGIVQPISLSTLPLVRVSTSQTAPDSAIAANGLVCLVYIDNSLGYYQVSDSSTGQQIVSRTALPSTATNPRVFVLGNYFAITYMATVGGVSTLQVLFVSSTNASTVGTVSVSGTSTVVSLTTGYDGVVLAGNLYLAWSATSTTIAVTYVTSSFSVAVPVIITGHTASLMSLAADPVQAFVWVTFWDSTSTNGYTLCYNQILGPALSTRPVITAQNVNTLTSAVTNPSGAFGTNNIVYEVANTYISPYPTTGVKTDYLNSVSCSIGGTVTQNGTILRSVGLGSKAFTGPNNTVYMLATYGELNYAITSPSKDQPTYFLIDTLGNIYMRLAYSNGGGYATSQVLPAVTQQGGSYKVAYLYADFLTTINKTTSTSSVPLTSIYTQTGVNLASIGINNSGQYSSEIAGALHLTGGQLWEYDGVRPVEHGFHVWPDNVVATTTTTGTAQTFYYQFTYEWTDNQGNLHRSAPSVPVTIQTAAGTPNNTLYVPTLRLTYKTAPNPVRIVGYRWSAAQQVYYQFTSVTNPTLNSTSVDFVTITDTNTDSAILGNAIIYTTGGVVEDIAAPACTMSALYKNRLFLVDAEDQNLLWFSKQVIEAVPVEMSDLLTLYIAPTSGAQGSTGPITALSAMDDKLIIFKRDAIYYLTGTGPDNTGANSDFSDPIFITSSVGCSNPSSIVLMPNGIMFQSDKGIWLLGRDLSTNYIGAPVEQYNSQTAVSAQSIPATNQVRFILNNSLTLMYDYFMSQWGVHSNISAISSTLYGSQLTYLNSYGQVFQETPNVFLDGSTPVLIGFTTAWFNVAGLQGYERFYQMLLLGTYYTPFKLNVQLAYDYNPSPSQATIVTPDNYGGTWGSQASWGTGGNWGGGPGNVFEARVFPQIQKCESFQVTVSEIYDPSLGAAAGQGLSLSGLNLLVGVKKGTRTSKASRSFG